MVPVAGIAGMAVAISGACSVAHAAFGHLANTHSRARDGAAPSSPQWLVWQLTYSIRTAGEKMSPSGPGSDVLHCWKNWPRWCCWPLEAVATHEHLQRVHGDQRGGGCPIETRGWFFVVLFCFVVFLDTVSL